MSQRAKILIVDDEPFNIDFLEQELEELAYDTIAAANGQEALEQVAAEAPDLVLLDIMMPVMDGFAVLAHLKANPATRDIPVVVISASNDMRSVVRGIKAGAEDFLPKPFDPTLLQARLSSCLAKKRMRDQELAYLRQVEQLTQAAAAVEAGAFDHASLDPLAARPDALGNLARVFQRMTRELIAREQRLRQQLQQLQLDDEERRRAATETAAVYIPMDRRVALARGTPLPDRCQGAGLFADVSGFTPLTAALAEELGPHRGAEELIRYLNQVYGALIDEVHRYGGSVVNFAGDAITCWFDDQDRVTGEHADETTNELLANPATHLAPHLVTSASLQAVACALAMQRTMERDAQVLTPALRPIALAIKVSVAAGSARRLLVGDPSIQRIDVLAGRVLERLSHGEHLATPGEVLVEAAIVAGTGGTIVADEWRTGEHGARFAVVRGLAKAVPATPWAALPPEALAEELVRPWLLPPVYTQLLAGTGQFLTQLRHAAVLFLSFQGLDYDNDPAAGEQLDAYLTWVQRVLAQHEGALLQVTFGDKGSYLYAAFGAPTAHHDDAVRAVAAATDLLALPAALSYIHTVRIGVAYGQMRCGPYGSPTHRTYGVHGSKTNLAARLMQASTDGILCDESIVQLTQTRLQYIPLPPIMVKGYERPVNVYEPVGELVQNVIASQLDQLTADQQLTLKAASVIGRRFAAPMLAAIHPAALASEQLDTHLSLLASAGLIVRHGEEAGATLYAFADRLLQETAYSQLLFAQRRQLHRAVAEWFERTYAADLRPHAALLAHHWEKAEDPARASGYLEQASQQARSVGNFDEAMGYLKASLTLESQGANSGPASYDSGALGEPARPEDRIP